MILNLPNELWIHVLLPRMDLESLLRLLQLPNHRLRSLCEIELKARYIRLVKCYLADRMDNNSSSKMSKSRISFLDVPPSASLTITFKGMWMGRKDLTLPIFLPHLKTVYRNICSICQERLSYPHPFHPHLNVCSQCAPRNPQFNLISRSQAIKTYGMTEQDLLIIKRLEKSSCSHLGRAFPAQCCRGFAFYQESEVSALAREIYGSPEQRSRILACPKLRTRHTKSRKRWYSEASETFKHIVMFELKKSLSSLVAVDLDFKISMAMLSYYPRIKPKFWGGRKENLLSTISLPQAIDIMRFYILSSK